MRQRSISAIGVVIAGVVPMLLGGPIFATVMVVLCLIGFHEYLLLAERLGSQPPKLGYLAIGAFGVVGLTNHPEHWALLVIALLVGGPLVVVVQRRNHDGAVIAWALAVAGSLYLGFPVLAAIALRRTGGAPVATWLDNVASSLALGWAAAPRGLAWLLTIVLVTWLGDTMAYLIGRVLGRRPLLPAVSPKKTVEGAIAGLLGSTATGAICVAAFGLGFNAVEGALFGLVLGTIGQLGDLAESLLKRQAGVKDSGALIPGHGGMLDRIDALLFTITAGWFLADLADRLAR